MARPRPMILKKRRPETSEKTREKLVFSSELSQDCSKQKSDFQSIKKIEYPKYQAK